MHVNLLIHVTNHNWGVHGVTKPCNFTFLQPNVPRWAIQITGLLQLKTTLPSQSINATLVSYWLEARQGSAEKVESGVAQRQSVQVCSTHF